MGMGVIFTNNDGTFVFNETTDVLTLGSVNFGTGSLGASSYLTAISGLTNYGIADQAVAYPDCTTTGCLGSLSLSTGALASGNILSNAKFQAGGSIDVTYTGLTTTGGMNNGTVSFTGTFSSAKWVATGVNSWQFTGVIMNGTLMVNGADISIPDAVTIQLTLTGGGATFHQKKDAYTFSDSGGTTNFSVAPEPGTLALFGGGLIAVGLFTRKRLGVKVQ
jgi:hypothetical protein